jgi:protein kinase-like protein
VPIEPGTKLGQYEVLELIGEGAMGSVYRAYHAPLERTGAVKVMHAISPDKDSIARFRHEAQAIARMRHPNILNVFDFGEYEGTPYMIVEYVPGGNLAGRMSQGPLDRGTALRFLRGIAAGLDYAHLQGIVHRDVKPANVLLERDETLVLADFGLAKLLQGSSLQSMTGVTTGTPAYMAPEQVTGHEVGPAADRYSLATIAYEMLTGSIPYEGLGILELLYAHVHQDPVRPSTLNPQLNEKVDAVIMRGLAKDPAARWRTCDAFVTALAAALGAKATPEVERTIAMAQAPAAERTIAAPGAQASDLLFAPPPITAPPPVWGPAVAAKRRARRQRVALIVIAILAVLALIAGALSLVFGDLFKPTLALSSPTVEPGAILTVNASHLPANQVGLIELQSELYSFWFQADGQGSISQSINIPLDIGIGGHHVSLCWDASCPLQVDLTVVAVGTLPNSTPSSKSSPTASGGPTPNPQCPFSSAALSESPNPVRAGQNVMVSGTNFKPGTVNLTYYAGTSVFRRVTAAASAACTFSTSLKTKVLLVGTRVDKVVACDRANRCATVKFTAKALL